MRTPRPCQLQTLQRIVPPCDQVMLGKMQMKTLTSLKTVYLDRPHFETDEVNEKKVRELVESWAKYGVHVLLWDVPNRDNPKGRPRLS